MGFPENEWHGHDLTSLVDGVASKYWTRLREQALVEHSPEKVDMPEWDDLDRHNKYTVKDALLRTVTDTLDVIYEQGQEKILDASDRLLDGLEFILSNYELHMGDKADLQPQPVRSTLKQISALVADARNNFQEV